MLHIVSFYSANNNWQYIITLLLFIHKKSRMSLKLKEPYKKKTVVQFSTV